MAIQTANFQKYIFLKQKARKNEVLNTFQLCQKVLKTIENYISNVRNQLAENDFLF